MEMITYRPTIYVKLIDFPKGGGKVVYKTVQARDDNTVLVNLDYDIDGKLVGIEILEHSGLSGIDELLKKGKHFLKEGDNEV